MRLMCAPLVIFAQNRVHTERDIHISERHERHIGVIPERALVGLLKYANLCGIHAKRGIIMLKDIQLARRISRELVLYIII